MLLLISGHGMDGKELLGGHKNHWVSPEAGPKVKGLSFSPPPP